VLDIPCSSCVGWEKTADTTDYADLLSNAGMCSSVGNILAASASGVAASTTVGGSSSGSSAGSSFVINTKGGVVLQVTKFSLLL
jgi:hypothetical protein